MGRNSDSTSQDSLFNWRKMKMLIIAFGLSILISLKNSVIWAQPLGQEEIKQIIIKDWLRAKEFTIDYLNAMPADKYSFKPVDSIRSFAQQMLHLDLSNVFLMSNATDSKPLAFGASDLEHSPGAQKKDSVIYYVSNSYDYCVFAINDLPVNKWGEIKDWFGFKETRFAFMLKAFEHQVHHRGQTTIYIRLQGIRPPPER
jgi:hypothetical protein